MNFIPIRRFSVGVTIQRYAETATFLAVSRRPCAFILLTNRCAISSKMASLDLSSFAYGGGPTGNGRRRSFTSKDHVIRDGKGSDGVTSAAALPGSRAQSPSLRKKRTALIADMSVEHSGALAMSGSGSVYQTDGAIVGSRKRKASRSAVQLSYEEEAAPLSPSSSAPASVMSTPTRPSGRSGAGASGTPLSSPPRPPSSLPFPPPAPPAGSSSFPPTQTPPGSPLKGYGKPIQAHARWREQLEHIKAMRAVGGVAANAAVDSMGCERCTDPTAEPRVRRFQTLVGLLLSSQTRDEVTYATVQRLIAANKCTPEAVAACDVGTLEGLLFGPPAVGFWRNKAKFLQGTASICVSQYGGDIPDTIEGLVSLPGVGPKMAFIAISVAWGQAVGIGVDTHVHRVANRLGWVHTATPEATREHLQSWLPREEWAALNVAFVGFGQTVCSPISPKCGQCMNVTMCPVGQGHKSAHVVRT